MRTTLNIDDDLLKEAKIMAVREGTTLTALLERALREVIAPKQSGDWEIPAHIDRNDAAAVAAFIAEMESKRRLRGEWELSAPHRGGPRPGLNLDSTSELIEQVEGPLARP
ncbi:MAG: type II toxin-antitoxin system VapB family antitoxin [Dehalococcoidia bacterium]|nr:type II toxin-antitoxin system VapB family antitoxin [Dehalococcoidia bacterium]